MSSGVRDFKRLGKNLGGYLGERIDIDATLADIATLAGRGWEMERIPAFAGIELLALRRRVPQPRRRIYISSGIHGDEPAGPLAMQQLLADDTWPDDADLWSVFESPRFPQRHARQHRRHRPQP